MAQAQTTTFGKFLIELGDGATPTELFKAPCGMNSRGFKRTAATNTTNVPDCDDPDAPSWLETDVVSLAWSLSGSGVAASEDFATWETWFHSGVSKNIRITRDKGLATEKKWTGAAKLTDLEYTGQRGNRNTFTVAIAGDGILSAVAP
ncbi:phage tail tube protein [Bradyrhizobium sp. USDA 4452]